MPTECITFRETNYFSSLICDYLEEREALQPLYNRFPKIENFKAQIEEKAKNGLSEGSRKILSESLLKQYQKTEASEITLQNIEALKKQNTFTITTGHQLNLFTGPLYFLYKIVSTINLSTELKQKYPEYNFVPIYWMATEDHDFEEINFFNFKGKKVQWNRNASGAVGELSTEGLDVVFQAFSKELGVGNNARALRNLFQEAYTKHTNLADATRYLANALFAAYGLVIVDANTKELKQLFVPFIEEELSKQSSFQEVSKTNKLIEELGFGTQVNPREINLFYLTKKLRERIVFENNVYSVINSDISWSESEILEEVKSHPERFSPNVIMRPLYQEVILPNLCYIGGGGELAYWFQLQDYFKKVKVVFPMLLLRNSALIKTQKQAEIQEKLNLSTVDLFLNQEDLLQKKTRELSAIEIDFSKQKAHLEKQFADLYKLAEQTDKSFLGAVAAQERKQIKGLENLEKRLMKAQKRKLQEQLEKVKTLQNQLFPNCSLQERNANFSPYYLEHGEELIPELIKELKPLRGDFTIITI
ncbi:bacillithiol biosynthesis cysteine-adding enzyme BshC [Oceanihabitans sediminis]|uniref:bacillithiol biosynthesis cysteine-adding enzyme BshC n=1 Tax=Oceanihabitans sediminis TaxID=1812012 RepID=UPI000930A220|nr:bacillithiol biosynthesis cysteine-adding enzyme BshC [Oceanihabitans sediminis]MDX1278117.1 bacillithiol biosynthesis cysteine-adding enzyme BshC [Oceanihabitans sediminis]